MYAVRVSQPGATSQVSRQQEEDREQSKGRSGGGGAGRAGRAARATSSGPAVTTDIEATPEDFGRDRKLGWFQVFQWAGDPNPGHECEGESQPSGEKLTGGRCVPPVPLPGVRRGPQSWGGDEGV